MALRQRLTDDPPIDNTILLLTPYAAYLPAEHLGASGVLAAVAAGFVLSRWIPPHVPAQTRLQAHGAIDLTTFLLNALVFILVGLQLRPIIERLPNQPLLHLIAAGSLTAATVIVVRLAWVFPGAYLPHRLRRVREHEPRPPAAHVALVGWTGMRGVVSLAAALALPYTTTNGQPLPDRDVVIFATFTVVLITLLLPGLTLPIAIRRLNIHPDHTDDETRAARQAISAAALRRLDTLADRNTNHPEAAAAQLRTAIAEQLNSDDPTGPSRPDGLSQRTALQLDLVATKRREPLRLRHAAAIHDDLWRDLEQELDVEEIRLQHRRPRPPPAASPR